MKKVYCQLRFVIPFHIIMLMTSILPDNFLSIRVRGFLVSLFLPGLPKRFSIGRDVTILGLHNIAIGENVYIAKGSWINALGGIKLENEVMLGPYVVMATAQHQRDNRSYRFAKSKFNRISVGAGTWIGSHTTIQAGALIGSGCVVGSNSVVIGEFGDDELIVGVPATSKLSFSDD